MATLRYDSWPPSKVTTRKDPRIQLRGAANKQNGARFEQEIDLACQYYSRKKIAEIEKTPEPMRPIGPAEKGVFKAVYTASAQPDYSGVLASGRAVMFEAKYTATEKINQHRVTPEQTEKLSRYHELGGLCFVLICFGCANTYRIPWEVWTHMKEKFGRKYLTEQDVSDYQLRHNPCLLFLEGLI